MGMDIYAGTFTRYYARNWKTKAQQYAEANGMAFHRISPDGENLDDQDSPDVTEIQKAVSAWTNGLLKALQSNNMDAGLASLPVRRVVGQLFHRDPRFRQGQG